MRNAMHRASNPGRRVPGWALLVAALLATQAGPAAQDVLTLRGPGSQVGATFRNVTTTPAGDVAAVVVDVRAKSPAALAGLREGDRVTRFDGLTVRGARDLSRLVAETPPGRTVDVAVTRDGRMLVLKMTPRS